jgi:hypothetical protein
MNNIDQSYNLSYKDSGIVFQSARRDWDDLKIEYYYWSPATSFVTTFIFIFCIIKQIYYPSLSFFAAIFGTFAIALGTILWTLYLFYGTKCLELTSEGLNYHWKILFMTRNYLIPIEDVKDFFVRHLYFRQDTKYSLIVRTSDVTLTLLICNHYECVEEIAKQLNISLIKIKESNNNVKIMERVFVCDIPDDNNIDVSEKQSAKCTFPHHSLFLIQPKNSFWTFMSNQAEHQFTINRTGHCDWLVFFNTATIGSALITIVWLFVGRFFTDPQNYKITVTLLAPILLTMIIIVPLFSLSLLGRFYKEQWTFSPDLIINKITFFCFETVQEYKLSDSGQFFLERDDQSFCIFFPFYSAFNLSFLQEDLVSMVTTYC